MTDESTTLSPKLSSREAAHALLDAAEKRYDAGHYEDARDIIAAAQVHALLAIADAFTLPLAFDDDHGC